jgi:hypothetical protein
MPWSGAKVFETKIRRNIKLAESPGHGEHIIKYDPGSNGAADYRALARELLGITAEQGVEMAAAANPPPVPAPAPAAKPKRQRKSKAAASAAAATAPAPAEPKVELSVNREIDPQSLAAAHVAENRPAASTPDTGSDAA